MTDAVTAAWGSEVARLREFPGVESVTLDFPVSLIVNREVVARFHHFPESLVQSAGRLRLGLELSVYASVADSGRASRDDI